MNRHANDETKRQVGEDIKQYANRMFDRWQDHLGYRPSPYMVVRAVILSQPDEPDRVVVAVVGLIGDWASYASNSLTGTDLKRISESGNRTSYEEAKALFADLCEVAPWRD